MSEANSERCPRHPNSCPGALRPSCVWVGVSVIIIDMFEIGPVFGIFIMMNNYFHDVATALLLTSGVGVWNVMRSYDESKASRETTEYFLRVFDGMTKLAKISLWWILIGGIPRTIFYRSFEWANAVAHAQIPALIVKHVLAFAFVGTGVTMWHKYGKRVKAIRAALGETK